MVFGRNLNSTGFPFSWPKMKNVVFSTMGGGYKMQSQAFQNILGDFVELEITKHTFEWYEI